MAGEKSHHHELANLYEEPDVVKAYPDSKTEMGWLRSLDERGLTPKRLLSMETYGKHLDQPYNGLYIRPRNGL